MSGAVSTLIASIAGGGAVEATGGTELTPGDGSKYHVFVGPGTLSVSSGGEVTYLIVGGGGGAGSGGSKLSPSPAYNPYVNFGGGGGAGGVLTGTTTISATPYPITVGTGGAAGPVFSVPTSNPYYNLGNPGSNGGDSTFNSLTAYGGGGGGGRPSQTTPPTLPNAKANASPGGSGGGGGSLVRPGGPISAPTGFYLGSAGSGTPGQGYPGRQAANQAYPYYNDGGGSGGGAGGSSPSPLVGGPALACPEFPAPAISPAIPAPAQTNWTTDVGPTGRFGTGGPGGGNSVPFGWTPRTNGTDYTGMGGRARLPGPGGGTTKYVAYAGGDGIVIIKYPAPA
jgi:hypothetical protein